MLDLRLACHTAAAQKIALTLLLCLPLTTCAGGSKWRSSGINYPVQITWNDARWCVPMRLRKALRKVSQRFGPVTVHSTHRWPIENWRKGGKPRSFHLSCRAVDFSVRDAPTGVTAYLETLREVGGYSYYPQGFYHIDNGPRRTW